MKRIIIYGIIIFIFSFGIGYYYSKLWKNENIEEIENISSVVEENVVETTAVLEEKVGIKTEFALKKYYNECGHVHYSYSELPNEFINLTKKEIENIYSDWRVEEFSSDRVTLAKNIDKICDNHYVLKLGKENIEIYKMIEAEDFELVRETNISKEYLTNEDVEKLEEGIFVFGISDLNSALEDFE